MTQSAATERTLDIADLIARNRGAALTPIRREVLSHLLEAKKPTGAYALLDQIKLPKGRMMPATVYRALDFLIQQGFIHRIESMNAFVACTELDNRLHEMHVGQFVICTDCGKTLELPERRMVDRLRRAGEARGFKICHVTVELRGRCQDCQ